MSEWTQIRIRKETRGLLLGKVMATEGSYDDAIRDLLGVERVKARPAGRPVGTTKWPFAEMAVGEKVGLAPPAGGDIKFWDAMRTAVWRAEQGTGKRFTIHPVREAGKVWVTRVA